MDVTEMARLGGLARAENLTAKRRQEIAKKAAKAAAKARTRKAKQKRRQKTSV